jgi:FkbM family methyltransferase
VVVANRWTLEYWLAPPLWYAVKDALALRAMRGVSYRNAVKARRALVHLVPERIDLTAGLVVDLGANAGNWTAGVVTIPHVRVLAVEPAPGLGDALAHRFRSFPNVRIDRRAVDATAGEAVFHVTGDSVFGSLLEPDAALDGFYASDTRVTTTVTVPTVTLDELIAGQPVSLLKIDVQGAELRVFAGGPHTLAHTQAVLVEANFAPHYRFALWHLTPPTRAVDGRPLWADALYVRV